MKLCVYCYDKACAKEAGHYLPLLAIGEGIEITPEWECECWCHKRPSPRRRDLE